MCCSWCHKPAQVQSVLSLSIYPSQHPHVLKVGWLYSRYQGAVKGINGYSSVCWVVNSSANYHLQDHWHIQFSVLLLGMAADFGDWSTSGNDSLELSASDLSPSWCPSWLNFSECQKNTGLNYLPGLV